MDTKIKGVSFCSVYDVKPFAGEVNDEPSKTITTGYIPINEQVKMIMRGEITIGDFDIGYGDDDNLDRIPEEYFEDATDYCTPYNDDLREVIDGTIQKGSSNMSEHEDPIISTVNNVSDTEERVKQSDEVELTNNS